MVNGRRRKLGIERRAMLDAPSQRSVTARQRRRSGLGRVAWLASLAAKVPHECRLSSCEQSSVGLFASAWSPRIRASMSGQVRAEHATQFSVKPSNMLAFSKRSTVWKSSFVPDVPQAVLDLLAHHKADILRLLRPPMTAGRPRIGRSSSTSAPPLRSSTADCRGPRPRDRPWGVFACR